MIKVDFLRYHRMGNEFSKMGGGIRQMGRGIRKLGGGISESLSISPCLICVKQNISHISLAHDCLGTLEHCISFSGSLYLVLLNRAYSSASNPKWFVSTRQYLRSGNQVDISY